MKTWGDAEPGGRWRRYSYDELVARDKASLDIFWLRDESLEDSANLPPPDVLVAEIIDELRAALDEFEQRPVAESWSRTKEIAQRVRRWAIPSDTVNLESTFAGMPEPGGHLTSCTPLPRLHPGKQVSLERHVVDDLTCKAQAPRL